MFKIIRKKYLEELQNQIKELEGSNQYQRRKLNSLHNELHVCKTNNEKFLSRIETGKKIEKTLNEKLNKTDDIIAGLENCIKVLEKKNKSKSGKIGGMQTKINKLNDEKIALQDIIKNLQEENRKLKENRKPSEYLQRIPKRRK